MARTNEIAIFCSYAHADDDLRRELFRHLELLKRSGIIRAWYDGQIAPGQEWHAEIERELRSADVVLLLVSVDLLNSEFVRAHELPIALERHKARQAVVIPVLLRPVAWSLSGLDSLQALPDGLKPVVLWDPRDLAYVSICEGLVRAVMVWRKPEMSVAAADATPVPVTRRRVLDLGLPRKVPVGLSTVLAIMIRRPESDGLAGLYDLQARYGIGREEVETTERFAVRFPKAADGSLQPVEFQVAIETSDFDCGTTVKSIEVPARGDSDVCVFLLTARCPGRLLVNVELRRGDKKVASCLLKADGVSSAQFEPAIQASVGLDLGERKAWAKPLGSVAGALLVAFGITAVYRGGPVAPQTPASPPVVTLPSQEPDRMPPPKVEAPAVVPKPAIPKQIRVGGNVQAAKLLNQPKPAYPPLARQARIQGVVRFNAVIGRDGSIQNLTLVSGHPLLVPSATEAVRQWRYQPTLLNGEPVKVVTQIDVNFTLSQ